MPKLDLLTINEEPRDKEALSEILWKAFNYFPERYWNGITYLGNIIIKHDLGFKSGTKAYDAFAFHTLLRRIRAMAVARNERKLLLAVTHTPVIAIYYEIKLSKLKRVANLIRDYVSPGLGVVSFFEMEEPREIEVAAHGLGHSQGLAHHSQPVDIMYFRLLNGNVGEAFCDACQNKLRKRE
ncbi:MAG: M10 family metallopeptidase domain-containing protein [Candidatus Bathyarchaeota archaeon]|nr:M10 family metallopeptidase domain-containing protein [Candidatus Bathyarchaeota archaeon]